MNRLTALPHLGVGLGYRRELDAEICAHAELIDCLEIISEHYLDAPRERLEQLRELAGRFRLLPHGIEMSIGTAGDLDPGYVSSLARLVEVVQAPWCSDHLSYTRAGGVSVGQLTPLLRTRELASEIARKAREVQTVVGVPFLLENVTYYLDFPAELSEAEFLTRVVEEADCGLLLDVTNLHVNATNHGYDPVAFLDAIPLERVVQVHLAGGAWSEDTLLDLHAAPVHEEVWPLLAHVVARAPSLCAVTLERDQDFPDDFGELLADLTRARAALFAATTAPT